jgi:23S rRNA pseudouridine2604 synthase
MKYSATKSERINKSMQSTGLYSRRESDKLIAQNKVKVNGKIVALGVSVNAGDNVEIMSENKTLRYAKYYKPVGEETSTRNELSLNGLHPVGRLDKESEGLIVYTNDPTLTDHLLNPDNSIEKEYRVQVREKTTPRVERILLTGIYTQEATYKPVKNIKVSADRQILNITITEGKKHEIRRMLNALNLTIINLKRIRINNLRLGNMKPSSSSAISRDDLE